MRQPRNWEAGTREQPVEYLVGDFVQHGGKEYHCLQAHSGRGDPNWAPQIALSLWAPAASTPSSPPSQGMEPVPGVPSSTPPVAEPVTSLEQLDKRSLVIGFYNWTWGGLAVQPQNTTMSVAFSGWADVDRALEESRSVCERLQGVKYLSLGGGNENGRLTKARLDKLNRAISAGLLRDYGGVCFDIEEGDAGMGAAYSESFQVARAAGLRVLVTISHSAPYGVPDKVDLMREFLQHDSIDLISPQLYTSGTEVSNDYAWDGVPWTAYANCKPAVVPSIVRAGMFQDAQTVFAGHGVQLQGFVQWAQQ